MRYRLFVVVTLLFFVGCIDRFDVADAGGRLPVNDGGVRPDGELSRSDAGKTDSGSDASTNEEVVDCNELPTGGETREVGAGRTYETISAAVAAASAGDVVLVREGTYPEQVVVDKAITIAKVGDGDAWIDGKCSTTHANGFVIRAANVLVRCLGVRNTVDASVLITGSSAHDVSLEGMALQDYQCMQNLPEGGHDQGGVAAYYTGARIRVVGNTMRRRVDAPGEPRGSAYGIWFRSSTEQPSGGGHYIAYNSIEGGRDGIGGGIEDDDRGSFDADTIIEHNVVRGCDDDGIQVEGGNVNVVVRENRITGCPTGISLAPNRIGPLMIEDNVIENLVAGSTASVGRCFKVGLERGGTAYLRRNVCRTAMGDGVGQIDRGNSALVVEDNVFQVGRYVYELIDVVPPSTSFERNCVHTTDVTRFVKWAGVTYTTLAELQTNTGQEEGTRQTTDCSWLEQ